MKTNPTYVVGIDFGNTNSAYAINEIKNGRPNVYCYSPITSVRCDVKGNTDLLVSSRRIGQRIRFSFENTQFYTEGAYASIGRKQSVIIRDFKKELYSQHNGMFQLTQVLTRDVFCKIPNQNAQFLLKDAFTIVYALMLRSVFTVLSRDYLLTDYSNVRFVCTVPYIATQEQSIFTLYAFIQAYNMVRQKCYEFNLPMCDPWGIMTVSESIASFLQIQHEQSLDFPQSKLIMMMDFGGCTTDITMSEIIDGSLPKLTGGTAYAEGGSYFNKLLENILVQQCQITQDIGPFMRKFEYDKYNAFEQSDIQLDLNAFQFNDETAEANINPPSETQDCDIYLTEKMLFITGEYFTYHLSGFLDAVEAIVKPFVAAYKVPDYIFLTGGFVKCGQLVQYICSRYSTSQTYVHSAKQPSTSIACGSSMVLTLPLERHILADVVVKINGNAKTIISKNRLITQLSFVEHTVKIGNQPLVQFELLDGKTTKQFTTPRYHFAVSVTVKCVLLPQSNDIQVYYKWDFDEHTAEAINNIGYTQLLLYNIAPLSELLIYYTTPQPIIDCSNQLCSQSGLDQYLKTDTKTEISAKKIPAGGSAEHLLARLISHLIVTNECVYIVGSVLDCYTANMFLPDYARVIVNGLLLNYPKYEHYCKMSIINEELFQRYFHICRQIAGDFYSATWTRESAERIVAYIVQLCLNRSNLVVYTPKFSVADCQRLKCASTCLIDSKTCILKCEDCNLLISQTQSSQTALINLGRAFASPVAWPLAYAVLTHHFGRAAETGKYNISVVNESVQLHCSFSSSVTSYQLLEAKTDLRKIGQIAGLVGKSIISLNSTALIGQKGEVAPCIGELISHGVEMVSALFYRASYSNTTDIDGLQVYGLSYKNIMLLADYYDELVQDCALIRISLVADLDKFDPHFYTHSALFTAKNAPIPTQMVIVCYQDVYHPETLKPDAVKTRNQIEAKMDTKMQEMNNTKPIKMIMPEYAPITETPVPSWAGDENCEGHDLYKTAACFIDSFNQQRILRLCRECAEKKISKELAKATIPRMPEVPTFGTSVAQIFVQYPLCQIGQLYWVYGGFRMLFMRMFTGYLIISPKFVHCPQHKIYATTKGVPVVPGIAYKCPLCPKLYCSLCKEWHDNADQKCAYQMDIHKCKNCGLFYTRSSGCNHITCPCGAHNCYKCNASFTNEKACYAHLTNEHGGYYG